MGLAQSAFQGVRMTSRDSYMGAEIRKSRRNAKDASFTVRESTVLPELRPLMLKIAYNETAK